MSDPVPTPQEIEAKAKFLSEVASMGNPANSVVGLSRDIVAWTATALRSLSRQDAEATVLKKKLEQPGGLTVHCIRIGTCSERKRERDAAFAKGAEAGKELARAWLCDKGHALMEKAEARESTRLNAGGTRKKADLMFELASGVRSLPLPTQETGLEEDRAIAADASPGSQASPEAPSGSSPSVSIPIALIDNPTRDMTLAGMTALIESLQPRIQRYRERGETVACYALGIWSGKQIVPLWQAMMRHALGLGDEATDTDDRPPKTP